MRIFRHDLMRKPVFGVSDQVPHKPGCTSTQDSYRLEISYLGSREIYHCGYPEADRSASLFSHVQKGGFLTTWLQCFACLPHNNAGFAICCLDSIKPNTKCQRHKSPSYVSAHVDQNCYHCIDSRIPIVSDVSGRSARRQIFMHIGTEHTRERFFVDLLTSFIYNI